MNLPKISVIIPMFNAEKYIGDCLDSLLAQTFRDFEVIVVDDCSTDGSHSIVQSYAEKFGGRLKISRTKKNSGSPGEPGNIGVKFSRGEYLSVLDNDDRIIPTAFEELYRVAKQFGADVVACEKYFSVPNEFWNDFDKLKTFQPKTYPAIKPVSEPTLIDFDVAERVKGCYDKKFLWPLWSKLIRRDFLIENEITFAKNLMQDMLATCCIVYSAEKLVLVPNVINIYRVRQDSLWHNVGEPKKFFRKYLRALIEGFEYLEKFLSGREFFNRHSDMKNLALEIYVREILDYLVRIYQKFPTHEFDDILREEFSKNSSAALNAFIFSSMNGYMLKFFSAQQKIFELEEIIRQDKAYIAELEKFIVKTFT